MLRHSPICWAERSLGSVARGGYTGVKHALSRRGPSRFATRADNKWVTRYWSSTLNDERRAPFWVSDFKHRYLIRTGKEHTGPMPPGPAPGSYPNLHPVTLQLYLRDFKPADRETRRLPLMPRTARVVYEHDQELKDEVKRTRRANMMILDEAKELELFQWYQKLQRVRGRWCRDQGVTSRGVYSPAVDASELWG